MEYTQEQIDAMVAEKVAAATKGLFDETELTKRVGAETDRRVESGIQKGMETQKAKWQEEADKKAQMSAEEFAKEKLAEQTKGLVDRERDLNKRANVIKAKDALSTAQIPKAQYESMLDLLVTDDEAITDSNVANFVTMFTSTKAELETSIKSELSKVPTPKVGDSNSGTTKADFTKLGYAEKVAFKVANPELYKQFMS